MLTGASISQNCFFSHLLNWVLGFSFFKSLNTGGKFTCQEGWGCPQRRTLIMLCGHLNNNTDYVSNRVMSFSKLALHSWCLDHTYLSPWILFLITYYLCQAEKQLWLLGECHLARREHYFLGIATKVVHSLLFRNLSRSSLSIGWSQTSTLAFLASDKLALIYVSPSLSPIPSQE